MKLIKNRKTILLMLVAVLVLTMAIPSMAGDPVENDFIKCNAISYESIVNDELTKEIIKLPNKDKRLNPAAALYKADATQSAGEDKFVSLRGFDQVTYEFGEQDTNKAYRIYNHPGTGPKDYDISLTEVTWGSSWHLEAVEVILVDVEVEGPNGVEIRDTYPIGTAFNKFGGTNIDNSFQTFDTEGNFAITGIFFPSEVKSAGAVKLVDVTSNYNPVTRDTYNAINDDGYDLDAMTAYYVKEVGVNLDANKIVTGTADFTTTTFAFQILDSNDPATAVAKGSAVVNAKNAQTEVVFTNMNDEPIEDWTKVLNHNETYTIVETTQGDYTLTFSGDGISEDGQFTVRYGEKDGTTDFPQISILATNSLDQTVAGRIGVPDDDEELDDESGVLGILEHDNIDKKVLGKEAKTTDTMNILPLLILVVITMSIIGVAIMVRRTKTEK